MSVGFAACGGKAHRHAKNPFNFDMTGRMEGIL